MTPARGCGCSLAKHSFLPEKAFDTSRVKAILSPRYSEIHEGCDMIVDVANELGKKLSGRVLGRKHFAKVCDRFAHVPLGSVVCLDFGEVEFVTGSWLNAMVVPLWRSVAETNTNLFPMLRSGKSGWFDELRLVADWNHQCYFVGNGRRMPPLRALLVGNLDPAQRTCLEVVTAAREVTGAGLERDHPQEGIGATAWNNRLKDLFEKRLIRREKRGREQVYSSVVQEVEFDG